MDFLSGFKRVLREQARRSILQEAALGVVPRQIRVTVSHDPEMAVEVRYKLAAPESSNGRPVVVDASATPMRVKSISCTSGSTQQIGPNAWMLHLASGKSWDCAVIECTLRSSASDLIGNFAVPDHIPYILNPGVPGPLPHIDVQPSRVAAGGVAYDGGGFEPHALLQAVVTPSRLRTKADRASPVMVVGRLSNELTPGEHERVVRLLSRIMTYHTNLYGMPVPARVLVAPAETLPNTVGGALLGIRRIQAFGLAGQPEPDDVMLGSRLAGLWWGTSIRIIGTTGQELEAALRAVGGILWSDHVDGAYRNKVLRDWRRAAIVPAVSDRWAGAQGHFRHGLHARWTLALYDGIRANPGVLKVIGALTRDSWGHSVTVHSVRSALAEAGIDL